MAPNLLLILSDQHRFCDLGCYGNPAVQTPNLDALAKSGVQLDRFYSNCPLCVPARGTLLTGRFPARHRAAANDLPVRTDLESLGSVLGRAGYRTAYVGKWHLGGVPRDRAIPPEERLGFQEWRGCNCNHDYYHAWYDDTENVRHAIEGYEPVGQTDLALDLLDVLPASGPWAMVVAYGTPHEPYELVPEETRRGYREQEPPFRENVRLPALLGRREIDGEELRGWYAGYYAHITELDRQVGRLLGRLEERGQREDTVVVYLSDHGDLLGSHGMTNKQLPYEEAVHVPFLLSWPRRVKPGRRDQLMGLSDVAPTLLGLLGLAFREGVDGENLQSLFFSEQAPGREALYLQDAVPCHQAGDRGGEEWRAVLAGDWLLARTPTRREWLLFNNRSDPYQLCNRAGDAACRTAARRLGLLLDELAARVDRELPWRDYLAWLGAEDAWNKSQAYFGLPLLPGGPV